jgi:hypothetical protein
MVNKIQERDQMRGEQAQARADIVNQILTKVCDGLVKMCDRLITLINI